MPSWSRFRSKCSPKVLGSNSHGLEINDLSVTWANGKKATRLCPCGYHGDPERECRCTPERIRQYQQKISGPLLDRFDIQLEVPRLPEDERKQLLTRQNAKGESSAAIRSAVMCCRELQLQKRGCINAQLQQNLLQEYCVLGKKDSALLDAAVKSLKLSTRAYFRILKIARTIADLAGSEHINTQNLLEAINYRRFDRFD